MHGTAAKITSDPVEDEPSLRRYGGIRKAGKEKGVTRDSRDQKLTMALSSQEAPGASLDNLHGSALLWGDIDEKREDWMDWPADSAKPRPGSAVQEPAQSSGQLGMVADPPPPEESCLSSVSSPADHQHLDPSIQQHAYTVPADSDGPGLSNHAGPSTANYRAPLRISHATTETPAMLAPATMHANETPCPRPKSRGGTKTVRTAHPSLLNSSRPHRPAMTVDMHDFGQYAVAEPREADPDKLKRQKDAFRAVTPITGRGPYSYYTNSKQL